MLQSDQEVPTTQYAMTVNENNVINNVNETATKMKLDKKVDLADEESLRLDVYYEKAENMLKEARVKSVPVTENTNMELTGISNFSDLDDGKLYFRLYKVKANGDETLLEETVVEKTTDVVPQLAEVTATRNGTNNVIFAGTRYGESDIQKVYYCAVPTTESGVLGWNKTDKEFTYTGGSSYEVKTYTIEVNGADSVNKALTGLDRGNAYKLYYVLENEKGSQNNFTTSEFVEVAEDKNVVAEGEVTELKYHKETGVDQFKFKWTAPTQGQQKGAKGYIVTIYDAQNNVVAVDSATSNATDYTLDAIKAVELGLGAGEYYITLVTKGDVTDSTKHTVNSAPVKSENTVKIGQIAKITNVRYVMDTATGKPKLTWTENDKNCNGEELTFKMDNENDDGLATTVSVREKTKAGVGVPTSFLLTVDKKQTTNSSALNGSKWEYQNGLGNSYITNYNGLNRASSVLMVAKAKTTVGDDDENAFYLDSEPTEFNFYIPYRKLETAAIESTNKSVTLNLDISGTNTYYEDTKSLVYGAELKDYTYKVRVYTSDGTFIKEVTPTPHLSDANDTDRDGEYDDGEKLDFTIDGLAANTDYKFRLVTTCGKFEAWSEFTSLVRTMPKIQGLTKAASDADCSDDSTTFYTDGTTNLRVEEHNYTDENYPSGQFTDLLGFLNTLETGDKVTIDGNSIELKLNADASAEDVLQANYVKDKYITVTGSTYEYALATNGSYLPKEVHIKSGQFDITELSVDADEGIITLGNNSVVTAGVGQELTIEAGATATVNGLKITTTKENVVRIAANDTIEVVANNNTLTFVNESAKVDGSKIPEKITIKFVSEDGNDAVQQGSITIINGDESEAKIVVTQENVTVEGGLTVDVKQGEVDVSDVNITSNKTVTLYKGATITARSLEDAPEELIGETVTIKNYASAEDLTAEFKNDASKGYEITSEVLARINTWLSSFGISGKGAKVTVGSENQVTIKNEGTETLQVKGLK